MFSTRRWGWRCNSTKEYGGKEKKDKVLHQHILFLLPTYGSLTAGRVSRHNIRSCCTGCVHDSPVVRGGSGVLKMPAIVQSEPIEACRACMLKTKVADKQNETCELASMI